MKNEKENVKTLIEKGQFDDSPFNLILKSEVLSENDLKSLEPLKEELKETFLKSQVFRTRTEAEVSVLNNVKHPTPASKYWQSVREQNVMFHELVMLSYEYRKEVVEIKKIDRKLNEEKDELELELLQIEKEKKIFVLRNMEKVAKDRIREIKMWSEIKEREAKKMNKKELDNVDNHQLVSYTQRWINQSKIMGGNGSPAERQNLLGQLNSGITECINRGILEETIKDFSKEDKEKIYLDYNYKPKFFGLT